MSKEWIPTGATVAERYEHFRKFVEPELVAKRPPEQLRGINYDKPMGRRRQKAFDKASAMKVKN